MEGRENKQYSVLVLSSVQVDPQGTSFNGGGLKGLPQKDSERGPSGKRASAISNACEAQDGAGTEICQVCTISRVSYLPNSEQSC